MRLLLTVSSSFSQAEAAWRLEFSRVVNEDLDIFHLAWFGSSADVMPLVPAKVFSVCAMFRAGGYRSVENFLTKIKDLHTGKVNCRVFGLYIRTLGIVDKRCVGGRLRARREFVC